MMGQWVVVPDIRPWRGDIQRNWAPYFYSDGVSWSCLHAAQFAAQSLRRIGIKCYVDMYLSDGRRV